ncbi:MAG: hypothetical protein HY039_02365 [Nitrospirae bacterium]|nr:hypothetical protein [Nitrospirota bacterium]
MTIPARGRRRIGPAGICVIAARLLAAPVLAAPVLAAPVLAAVVLTAADVAEAANSFMAELDILEYSASKIEPVPDLALASLDGRTVNLRDIKGRPLLLVFWAST